MNERLPGKQDAIIDCFVGNKKYDLIIPTILIANSMWQQWITAPEKYPFLDESFPKLFETKDKALMNDSKNAALQRCIGTHISPVSAWPIKTKERFHYDLILVKADISPKATRSFHKPYEHKENLLGSLIDPLFLFSTKTDGSSNTSKEINAQLAISFLNSLKKDEKSQSYNIEDKWNTFAKIIKEYLEYTKRLLNCSPLQDIIGHSFALEFAVQQLENEKVAQEITKWRNKKSLLKKLGF